jgi:ABC-type Na+ transport system ATPase subunit NatA
MKKIKLTEETLTRIVERVMLEQQKETENKELMNLFSELKKDPDNQEIKDKISELTKKLGLSQTLTRKGAQELTT